MSIFFSFYLRLLRIPNRLAFSSFNLSFILEDFWRRLFGGGESKDIL
jgi:hypothetical protein